MIVFVRVDSLSNLQSPAMIFYIFQLVFEKFAFGGPLSTER